MISMQDILAALGVVLNAIPQAIMAMNYGFAMIPTAIAYLIGVGGCLVYGSSLPISMQAETIAMAGTMGKDIRERFSMILYAGMAMAVLGLCGALNSIVNFAGENVICAMMAGVGIILTKTALDFVKEDKLVGVLSMITGLLIYLFTQGLVYTIIGSVAISSATAYFKRGGVELEREQEKYTFGIKKPTINFNVIRGSLALMCLTIGANIAFGGITAGMFQGKANIDALTVYSGLADAVSALLGGAPAEAIISATAAAPHPMTSGILMMIIMAAILFTGLLPKIAKFVPAQSIAGFLFVLGAIVTVPTNAFAAFGGADNIGVLAGGITVVVTAISDPFIGLVAGIIMKLIAGPLGLVF